MVDWPDYLVNEIAQRKCVLFLGAGISANSKNKEGKQPATWNSFLKNIQDANKKKLKPQKKIVDKLLRENDFLSACEVIVDAIGEVEFGEALENEFRRPGYIPSDVHKIIYSLDSRIVITPNVDKIYEQYAVSESQGDVVVKSYYDDDLAKYLRQNDFLIIRAHGSVDDVTNVIFTHKQYSAARSSHSAFYKILDALILTHTFVFLGCGINDPDIQLVLENSNFMYPHCHPHYFVTAQNSYDPEIMKILRNNRNLEVLTYSNSNGKHSNFLKSLQTLSKKVDAQRENISRLQSW